jgi:hypothetical protein
MRLHGAKWIRNLETLLMNALLKIAALALLLPIAATTALAQTDYFGNLPEGISPSILSPLRIKATGPFSMASAQHGTAHSPSLNSLTTTRSASAWSTNSHPSCPVARKLR